MKRSIALIVDHPQRDLGGLVLTAFELCQRGFDCHLVPLNLQDTEVWALAPDFVLLNYLRRFNEPFVRRLEQARIPYGLLDTEGAVFGSMEEYTELHCEDLALLHGARCACIWGPHVAQYLIHEGLYDPGRLQVTGCPRFDLYAPQWRSVVLDGVEVGDGSRPRILMNANFSIVNPRFTTSEENIALYHAQLGWSMERLRAYTDTERVAIAETIDLARIIAKRFPECTIVVRPHPHESPEPYRSALADVPNVELNVDGPVQPQIFRARAVVQRSCTTAIEAALGDVPTLSPRWITPPMEAPMSEAVSIGCESPEAVCATLEEVLAGTYEPDAELRRNTECVIAEWFYRRDGLAFRRVADAVAAAATTGRTVDEYICRRYMHGLYVDERSAEPHLANRLRYRFGLSPHWSARRLRAVPEEWWTKSDKVFTTEQVRSLLSKIERAYRESGWDARSVDARSARDAGRYSHRSFLGQSVTLSC
ncbi:MAG TPA: surface carbohydrate biosynthesis protein [Gemmatimonadaceae bacterium]|nr:surface carbohydrate biosynthesis protein [Gemmatimonadaceae bacterium]